MVAPRTLSRKALSGSGRRHVQRPALQRAPGRQQADRRFRARPEFHIRGRPPERRPAHVQHQAGTEARDDPSASSPAGSARPAASCLHRAPGEVAAHALLHLAGRALEGNVPVGRVVPQPARAARPGTPAGRPTGSARRRGPGTAGRAPVRGPAGRAAPHRRRPASRLPGRRDGGSRSRGAGPARSGARPRGAGPPRGRGRGSTGRAGPAAAAAGAPRDDDPAGALMRRRSLGPQGFDGIELRGPHGRQHAGDEADHQRDDDRQRHVGPRGADGQRRQRQAEHGRRRRARAGFRRGRRRRPAAATRRGRCPGSAGGGRRWPAGRRSPPSAPAPRWS